MARRKRRDPAGSAAGSGRCGKWSLTITCVHTGIRTIIGVESFHGPVRDGKGWDRLAMVIRHDGLLRRGGLESTGERHSQSGRSVKDSCVNRGGVVLVLAQH